MLPIICVAVCFQLSSALTVVRYVTRSLRYLDRHQRALHFKVMTNIRSVRSTNNKWIQQCTGLCCILNADVKVLTWTLTKRLSFQHTENVLLALKQRLDAQGQQVKEFFIDNCCSLRSKLQGILGSQLKVYLDIIHVVQRVSKNVPKRHPSHAECMRELQMVF